MVLLAIDDTDTRDGGCTTHTAFHIASAVAADDGDFADWGLVAPPRLVRLAPTIREKTRGNGAVVLPLGPIDPAGDGVVIGFTPTGAPLRVGTLVPRAPHRKTLEALRTLVLAHLPEPGIVPADPQPGAVLLLDPPSERLYEQAVAGRVEMDAAWSAAPAAIAVTEQDRRGTIGALAAAAWRPTPSTLTWEATGYRSGADPVRQLPAGFAAEVAALRGGFDNVDEATGRLRCVPRTPCPVRFGVRGLDPDALLALAAPVWSDPEAAGGWLLATNHARDAHLAYAWAVPGVERVVRLEVTVLAAPVTTRGGHVFVTVGLGVAGGDESGHADGDASGDAGGDTGGDADDDTAGVRVVRLAAFEPTKGLRGVVRRLQVGDGIEVFGRCALDPDLIALERFRVRTLVPRRRPASNPVCGCGRRTKSRGKAAGFRCPGCGTSLPGSARGWVDVPDPSLEVGAVYQVPDHVRGHLLGPLEALPPARALSPVTGWVVGNLPTV